MRQANDLLISTSRKISGILREVLGQALASFTLVIIMSLCFGFGYFARFDSEIQKNTPQTLTKFCKTITNPKLEKNAIRSLVVRAVEEGND